MVAGDAAVDPDRRPGVLRRRRPGDVCDRRSGEFAADRADPTVFAVRNRYTGAAMANNLGAIVGGAVPPVISPLLMARGGDAATGHPATAEH